MFRVQRLSAVVLRYKSSSNTQCYNDFVLIVKKYKNCTNDRSYGVILTYWSTKIVRNNANSYKNIVAIHWGTITVPMYKLYEFNANSNKDNVYNDANQAYTRTLELETHIPGTNIGPSPSTVQSFKYLKYYFIFSGHSRSIFIHRWKKMQSSWEFTVLENNMYMCNTH